MISLGYFVEFCMSTPNDATIPKMTINFCRILETLVVGLMYQALSTSVPLRDLTMLSQTTNSG